MSTSTAVVAVRDLVKSFGATRAVRGVSLDVPAGSVLGLVGENGAGKSTLAKLIAGIESPDSGSITVSGRPVTLRDPHEGLKAGISMMAQEIMLVPEATVEENVLLGSMPRRGPFPNKKAMRKKFTELVELTEFDLDPDAKVSGLRIADQQKTEMMRALSQDAELIIMDEPSAALTADEVERLHEAIRKITARGSAVLLISHYLEEVLALADRVAIMRDGEIVRVAAVADETVDTLVASMVGRALDTEYHEPRPQATGPVRLAVSGLSRSGSSTTSASRSARARSSDSPASSARAARRLPGASTAPTPSTVGRTSWTASPSGRPPRTRRSDKASSWCRRAGRTRASSSARRSSTTCCCPRLPPARAAGGCPKVRSELWRPSWRLRSTCASTTSDSRSVRSPAATSRRCSSAGPVRSHRAC